MKNSQLENKIIKIFDITKQEFYDKADITRKGDYLFYQNLLNGFLIKSLLLIMNLSSIGLVYLLPYTLLIYVP